MIKNLKQSVNFEYVNMIDAAVYDEYAHDGLFLVSLADKRLFVFVFQGIVVSLGEHTKNDINFRILSKFIHDDLESEVEEHFHPNEPISDHVQNVSTEEKIPPVPFKDKYETERQNFLLRLVAVSQCPEEYLKLQLEAK